MTDKKLRWNFNKESYQPNSLGTITFYFENNSEKSIFISDIGIQFDWMDEKLYHIDLRNNYGKVVPPRKMRFITNINFEILKTISGQHFYRIYYHEYEYNEINDIWKDLGGRWSEKNYFIIIIPLPIYRVFITRSLKTEDRCNGDEIVRSIKEWGFEPKTVEFQEQVSNFELRESLKREILNNDCLIAIATPRYLDALSGVWRTFPYFHNEVGIAFGHNFPILILVDNRVSIDGLPTILREYIVEFDSKNLTNIKNKLNAIMPLFRDWVKYKKRQEFFDKLGKIGLGVGLFALGGITGALLIPSKNDN